jgi:hypothetical protein
MFLEDQTLTMAGGEEELRDITDMSGYPTERTEMTEIAEMVSYCYIEDIFVYLFQGNIEIYFS